VVKTPRQLELIVLGLWLAVILGVTIRGIATPHQNSVFLVFRDAGDGWLGAQPLYSAVGKYLYSPLAAAFFAPFALLPDWAGSALWRLATGCAYLVAILYWFSAREEVPSTPASAGLLRGRPSGGTGSWTEAELERSDGGPLLQSRVSGQDVEAEPRPDEPAAAATLWRAVSNRGVSRRSLAATKDFGELCRAAWRSRELIPTVPATLALLLLLPLSIGNLNNGQASPLIIALLIFACLATLDGRWTLAAACISIAVFFKVYPLAIGLLLAVIEPRRLTWRIVLALLICGALSLVLQRPAYVIDQYVEWWRSLIADRRRVSTELGSWRDTWLLLRILHVPITVAGYAVLQAGTAVAAAIFCWWRSRTWNRAAAVWSAFSIGCLWITLFGPSTELATYVFLAPSVAFACSWVLVPMIQGRQPLHRFEFLPIAAYALLLLAEALNAWVPVIRQNTYLHAIQPVAALLFLGFVIRWKPVPFQPADLSASY
jgi:Glycosyltransferase family 87